MADPLVDASRLVANLRDGAVLRDSGGVPEVVETHISWVLLAGEVAYKIKKPVDLGFADFSTLERRGRFCEEEVRLNRRLAPKLYRRVVRITGSFEEPVIDGRGDVIEYAVEMRRFPRETLLSRVLERGELAPAHVDGLAETMAAFHGGIAVAAGESEFGSPERVWDPVAENFDHVAPGIDDPLVRELAGRSQAMFEGCRDALVRRKAGGFIRECHGDMHLGNMLLLDGRVVVFDGIEFNDDLRWIDVLSEVAFVVMDLEDRGRPDLARRLLNVYLERTGDYEGTPVLPFYLTYRAMVRAKVASIRSRQTDVAEAERERLREECRGYLKLADRYSRPGRPVLIATHGVSGSGKTTVTQPVLEAIGAIRLRSDVERKRLRGLEPLERGGSSLYSGGATERTYERLAACAESVLKAGFPAVVDATFLSRSRRDQFGRLAERLGVPFVILDVRADEAALRGRVMRRSREARDASDADVTVLEGQLREREPIGEDELRFVVTVEADRADAVAGVIEMIQARRGR